MGDRTMMKACPRCHRRLDERLLMDHSGMCTSCTSAPLGPVAWAVVHDDRSDEDRIAGHYPGYEHCRCDACMRDKIAKLRPLDK